MKKIILLFSALLVKSLSIGQTVNLDKIFVPEGNGATSMHCSRLDDADNLYIAGSFKGSFDFDPSSNQSILTSSPNISQYYLAKYNPSGNLMWAIKFGSGYSEDSHGLNYLRLDIDSNGDIVIAAPYQKTGDMDPNDTITDNLFYSNQGSMFIAKYTSSGSLSWHKETHYSNNRENTVKGLVLNSQNEIFLSGEYKGNFDIDPNTDTTLLTSNGSYFNIYLMKLFPDGAFDWAFQLGNQIKDDRVWNMKLENNEIVIAGVFEGLADFDPSMYTDTLTGGLGGSAYVAKYSTTGNYLWSKKIGERSGIGSIDILPTGSILTSGVYKDSADLDPGAGTFIPPRYDVSPFNVGDIFILQLDANGNFQWAKTMGSPGYEAIHVVKSLPDGRVMFGGHCNDSVIIDVNGQDLLIEKKSGYNNFLFIMDSSTIIAAQPTMHSSPSSIGFSEYQAYQDVLVSSTNQIFMNGYFSGTSTFLRPFLPDSIISTNGNEHSFVSTYHLSELGIKEAHIGEKSRINIFPNPAINMAQINSVFILEGSIISVHDLSGKLMTRILSKNNGSAVIDVSTLADGVYIIRLEEHPELGGIRLVKINK